jgi:hypothetical protein
MGAENLNGWAVLCVFIFVWAGFTIFGLKKSWSKLISWGGGFVTSCAILVFIITFANTFTDQHQVKASQETQTKSKAAEQRQSRLEIEKALRLTVEPTVESPSSQSNRYPMAEVQALQTVMSYPSRKGPALNRYLREKSSAPRIDDLGWSAKPDGDDWLVEYSLWVPSISGPTVYKWRVTFEGEVRAENGHAIAVTPRLSAATEQESEASPPTLNTLPRSAKVREPIPADMSMWLKSDQATRRAAAMVLVRHRVERMDPDAVPEDPEDAKWFWNAAGRVLDECMIKLGRTLPDPEMVRAGNAADTCYLKVR